MGENELQSETNKEPTRPRSVKTSSAKSVRASLSEQSLSSPTCPVQKTWTWNTLHGAKVIEILPFCGVSVSVDPSQILDSPLSLGISLAIPDHSPA